MTKSNVVIAALFLISLTSALWLLQVSADQRAQNKAQQSQIKRLSDEYRKALERQARDQDLLASVREAQTDVIRSSDELRNQLKKSSDSCMRSNISELDAQRVLESRTADGDGA